MEFGTESCKDEFYECLHDNITEWPVANYKGNIEIEKIKEGKTSYMIDRIIIPIDINSQFPYEEYTKENVLNFILNFKAHKVELEKGFIRV